MLAKDAVIPFVFETLPVRGALVQLENTWQRIQRDHDYPEPVADVLGHSAAATALIAQSLKFDGTITFQINSDGPLSMLVMQSTDDLDLRGMAAAQDIDRDMGFADLVAGARCAVTVDSGAQERPYQGIVEISPESLAASLEHYFERSVQVPSHLQLAGDDVKCGGILLQQMPGESPTVEDDWRRLGLLAKTLRAEDLTEGASHDLLHRLFAEDDVRAFTPRGARFRCRCSRRKVEEVLRLLGETETRAACEQQGKVEVTCEYCGRLRVFDAVDVARVFAEQAIGGSDSVH
ncbi:MAG: Hsp33 family molecular chaperone HslO [Woeseiaceae bacterium]|nr:Hsp33 family molecular chaperone HslO [Woeseiaceae bacterium]